MENERGDEDESDATTSDALNAAWDAVVVGAGLAGLAAATLLARDGHRVVVLDGGRPGGRARSDVVADHRVNRGAHALYDTGEASAVLTRLGVGWTGRPPEIRAGRLRVGDTTVAQPSSPLRAMTSRVLTVRDKVALARFLGALDSVDAPADVSALAWFESRGLSGRGLALVCSLARVGTYCGDLDRLSADAVAMQLRRALAGVTYVDGGWQVLVDGLLSAARRVGVTVVTHTPVLSVERSSEAWSVEVPHGATDGGRVHGTTVVLAGSGPAEASRLLGDTDIWPTCGEPVTAACLDLVTTGGGGVSASATPVLFSLDDPLYLSRHAPTVVQLLRYGARSAVEDRAQLVAHAAVGGYDVDAVTSARFLARMVVAHTVPSPDTGGLAGRPGVEVPGQRGAFVAGDWVGHRGLLADAALASAEEAAAAASSVLREGATWRVG
jgi:glycine/D-amino acid oxidase-like deaminating enzyme